MTQTNIAIAEAKALLISAIASAAPGADLKKIAKSEGLTPSFVKASVGRQMLLAQFSDHTATIERISDRVVIAVSSSPNPGNALELLQSGFKPAAVSRFLKEGSVLPHIYKEGQVVVTAKGEVAYVLEATNVVGQTPVRMVTSGRKHTKFAGDIRELSGSIPVSVILPENLRFIAEDEKMGVAFEEIPDQEMEDLHQAIKGLQEIPLEMLSARGLTIASITPAQEEISPVGCPDIGALLKGFKQACKDIVGIEASLSTVSVCRETADTRGLLRVQLRQAKAQQEEFTNKLLNLGFESGDLEAIASSVSPVSPVSPVSLQKGRDYRRYARAIAKLKGKHSQIRDLKQQIQQANDRHKRIANVAEGQGHEHESSVIKALKEQLAIAERKIHPTSFWTEKMSGIQFTQPQVGQWAFYHQETSVDLVHVLSVREDSLCSTATIELSSGATQKCVLSQLFTIPNLVASQWEVHRKMRNDEESKEVESLRETLQELHKTLQDSRSECTSLKNALDRAISFEQAQELYQRQQMLIRHIQLLKTQLEGPESHKSQECVPVSVSA